MFNAKTDIARWRARAALTCCFVTGGCGMITPPSELPAEVQFVVDNKASFAFDMERPLPDWDVPPETVIDRPDALDGCWGTILPLSTANGTLLGEWFFVEVFDSESSAYRGWFHQRDAFGVLTTLSGLEGEFSLVEDDHVSLRFFREMTSIPTGNLDTKEFDDPVPWDLRLKAITGDRMWIHYERGGGTTVGIPFRGGDLLYQRFDCPG